MQPRDASGPDRQRLAADLHRALTGELTSTRRWPPGSAAPAGCAAAPAARPPPPRVVWAVDGATDATILELRAADDVGLLYRVAHALELAGANVRAARISTLGSDVVDAFYLVGDWSVGRRPGHGGACRARRRRRRPSAAGRSSGPLRTASGRR